jgi:hypothetical protein
VRKTALGNVRRNLISRLETGEDIIADVVRNCPVSDPTLDGFVDGGESRRVNI